MIMASEVGVYDVEPADVVQKGRLMPGLFTSGQLMHFRFNRKLAVYLLPAFVKIILNFQDECYWLIHLKKVSHEMRN